MSDVDKTALAKALKLFSEFTDSNIPEDADANLHLRLGTLCARQGGGLTHTETQRGRLRTACGQRRGDGRNSQKTPATNSTSSTRQLLGAADAQTARPATFSTALPHQLLGERGNNTSKSTGRSGRQNAAT